MVLLSTYMYSHETGVQCEYLLNKSVFEIEFEMVSQVNLGYVLIQWCT